MLFRIGKWCACGFLHANLGLNVKETFAVDPTNAVWRFEPPAQLESHASVQLEKWTASVPADISHNRQCWRHSTVGVVRSFD